jgi:hypothetical protein
MSYLIPVTSKLKKGTSKVVTKKAVKSPAKLAPLLAAVAPMVASKLMEKV